MVFIYAKALFARSSDFAQKFCGINNRAIANHVHDMITSDARRHKMQVEFITVRGDNGVASVGPAIKTSHDVVVCGKHVREAALAFVAALFSQNCCDWHTAQIILQTKNIFKAVTPVPGILLLSRKQKAATID
jgi:hypothetical protein